MKSIRLFLVLSVVIVGLAYVVFSTGSRRFDRGASGQITNDAGDPAAALVIGDPIAFGNLTIFPVSSKVPRDDDRFITLDEGLKNGTVEVYEKGATPSAGSGEPAQTTETANAFPNAPPTLGAPTPAADPFAEPARQESAPSVLSQIENVLQGNAHSSTARANAVNELVVINHSDKPLYLMPGEIVIGGRQDRTVGQELVIAPDGKPVGINVFCVEHGRWGGREARAYAGLLAATPARTTPRADDVGGPGAIDAFQGNLTLNVNQTTDLANAGKFVGSIGSLNKAARIAVQSGEGQGKVWDEVAAENAKAGVTAQSGTFSGNYAENQSSDRLTGYVDHLAAPIAETQNIVGVIIAVNGQIETMDVFESTPLFKKLWPKLLKSYALDAANTAANGPTETSATRDAACGFLDKVARLKATASDADGELARSRGDSDDVLVFSAHQRSGRPSAEPTARAAFGGAAIGDMPAAFDGAIHSSGFSK